MSNYITENLGNVALTVEVEKRLREGFAPSEVHGFHRLPEQFNLQLVSSVRRWTNEIEGLALDAQRRGLAGRGQGRVDGVVVGTTRAAMLGGQGSRRLALTRRVGRFAPVRELRARLTHRDVLDRLVDVCSHDVVIYNPAGEINRGGQPLARFAEVAVAQAFGARTALVSFSFEPSEHTAVAARAVLPGVRQIYVRDELSQEAVVASGADASLVRVVPDVVIATEAPEPRSSTAVDSVAVAVNRFLDSADHAKWVCVAQQIRRTGAEVTFISNEKADLPALEALAAAAGGEARVPPDDYVAFARSLTEFDVVVGTRFHTLVLALVAGVGVVPVEGQSRRIRGAVETFGLSGGVVDAHLGVEELCAVIAARCDLGGSRLGRKQVEHLRLEVDAAYAELPNRMS